MIEVASAGSTYSPTQPETLYFCCLHLKAAEPQPEKQINGLQMWVHEAKLDPLPLGL